MVCYFASYSNHYLYTPKNSWLWRQKDPIIEIDESRKKQNYLKQWIGEVKQSLDRKSVV